MDNLSRIGHYALRASQFPHAENDRRVTLESVLRLGFAVGITLTVIGLLGVVFRLISPHLKSEVNRAYYVEGRFWLPMKVAKLLPVAAPLTVICLAWLSLLD